MPIVKNVEFVVLIISVNWFNGSIELVLNSSLCLCVFYDNDDKIIINNRAKNNEIRLIAKDNRWWCAQRRCLMKLETKYEEKNDKQTKDILNGHGCHLEFRRQKTGFSSNG